MSGYDKDKYAGLEFMDTKQTQAAYRKVDLIVNKSYLPFLEEFDTAPYEAPYPDEEAAEHVCIFPVESIVYDKKENIISKLAGVYSAAAAADAELVWILKGYPSGRVGLYLGVYDERPRISGAFAKAETVLGSFKGNFPGYARADILDVSETRIVLKRCFDPKYHAASCVSCIASLKNDIYGSGNDGFIQGIEKLIHAMEGKAYTAVILAKPAPPEQILDMENELFSLHSGLNGLAKTAFSVNTSQAQTISDTLTGSLTETVSHTKSATLSTGSSTSKTKGAGAFGGVPVGAGIRPVLNLGMSLSRSKTRSESISSSEGSTDGKSEGKTLGTSRGSSDTQTSGRSVQFTLESRQITDMLSNINLQLSRLKEGAGEGMFACAAYFLAPASAESKIAACTYKALVSGVNTNVEASGINTWAGARYEGILPWLKHMEHPEFIIENENEEEIYLTPATLVNAKELAVHMSLPKKSADGITVSESVSFARNINRMDSAAENGRTFYLGNIFHLGCEGKKKVHLDIESLTMHTFICGAPGSGKSNAIHSMMDNIMAADDRVKFMVIEPAKGEYKYTFGGREDFSVYEASPYAAQLLRLDPFRFDPGIHVLEHIDSLLSVFNVCWPMYAAMPDILRAAVQRAYEKMGWDLKTSKNRFVQRLFPDFDDVTEAVVQCVDESLYSAENKSDYKGSLCTRIASLKGGLNGMIFTGEDLSDEELFEKNVIVDLSRPGSPETKSLIMGILVMRLEEYAKANFRQANEPLKHITVLEEAHNLLKRTSTLQETESANITGKAVEMISNAIAEMRSYGEGFIIADQSPNLIDPSVMRNTKTKIIMSLSESSDKEAAGRAAGLKAEQIDELSRLPKGVGAVYQNGWLEAALVKMPLYKKGEC